MNKPSRVFGLDVLRALAVLLVFISHALRFSPVAPQTLAALELYMGFTGVELFFALSGFLIGGILLRENEKEISVAAVTKFWFRRWMRTLPVYYLVLFGTPLLYLLFFGENTIHFDDLLPYIFFVQNLAHPHPEYFGVAWSLGIEEWFYLLFPAVLLFFTFFLGNRKNKFLLAVFVFIAAGVILRLLPFDQNGQWDAAFRKIVLFRPDAIAFGLLMAWMKRYRPRIFLHKKTFALAGVVLLILCTFIFYRCGAQENKINFLSRQILLPLTGIAFSCLLPFASAWKNYRFRIPGKITVFISLISYSLYLVHSPVWEIYLDRFNEIKPGPEQWLIFSGYISISVFVAILVHYSIERPFLKLRDKLSMPLAKLSPE